MKLSKCKTPYANLFHLFKGYKIAIIVVLITIVANTFVCFFQPKLRSYLFDVGIFKGNWRALFVAIIFTILFFVIDIICSLLQFYCCFKVKNLVEFKITNAGLEKIMRLKLNVINEMGSLTLIENLQADAATVSNIADKNIIVLLSNLLGIIGSVSGLFILNWKMTIISLVIISLKIFHTIYFSRQQKKIFTEIMNLRARVSSWINNVTINLCNIKLWNLYNKVRLKMKLLCRSIIKCMFKSQIITESQIAINKFIDNFLNIILYIGGTYYLLNGEITAGELVAFISCVGAISIPIALVSFIKNEMAKVSPSLDRIVDLMDMGEEMQQSARKSTEISLPSYITFSQIDYACNSQSILHNITLTVYMGEKIALWGSNGSGKTTIIKLLLRLCSPTSGQILFDSIPIETLNIDTYRNLFSIVAQDTTFFDGTIEQNLFYSKEEQCKLEQILLLLGSLKIEDYRQLMVSNGSNFSGGERQKIALIRALIKDSKILILDEATANYDVSSAEQYRKLLAQISHYYPYVFIVSHQIEELQFADKIIVLDNGCISDVLSYSDFLKKYNDKTI